VHARASVERRSRERDRAFSHARGHLCVAGVLLDGAREKERLLEVYQFMDISLLFFFFFDSLAVFIIIHALDDLLRKNRGSVNRRTTIRNWTCQILWKGENQTSRRKPTRLVVAEKRNNTHTTYGIAVADPDHQIRERGAFPSGLILV